jgi:hypothetical protein
MGLGRERCGGIAPLLGLSQAKPSASDRSPRAGRRSPALRPGALGDAPDPTEVDRQAGTRPTTRSGRRVAVTAGLWRRRTPPGRSRLGKRVCQSTSRLLQGIVLRGDSVGTELLKRRRGDRHGHPVGLRIGSFRSRRGPLQSAAGPRVSTSGARPDPLAGISCSSTRPVDAPVTRAIASRASPAPACCSDPFANPRMYACRSRPTRPSCARSLPRRPTQTMVTACLAIGTSSKRNRQLEHAGPRAGPASPAVNRNARGADAFEWRLTLGSRDPLVSSRHQARRDTSARGDGLRRPRGRS